MQIKRGNKINNKYCSIAQFCGDVVDCRYLSLKLEYYLLSCEEAIALIEESIEWILNFLEDAFVVKWACDNKRLSSDQALASLKNDLYAGKGWSLTQEAYAISPVIYNLKTMNTYNRSVRYEQSLSTLVSADYPVFWKELFPHGREDNEKIIMKMLRIFRENGRKLLAQCSLPDMQACFFTVPHEEKPMHYHGSFVLDMNALCINRNLHNVSLALSELAKRLAEKYVNLNARVQLQPAGRDHYLKYFGGYNMLDGSHIKAGCSANELYKTYYVPGVEWFNILSPRAQVHLSELDKQNALKQDIDIASISKGSLVVQANKSIDDYDISDALALKRIIAPSLYPGMRRMSLKSLFEENPTKFWFDTLPRCNWAIVPVLDEEIDIVGSELVFRSKHL